MNAVRLRISRYTRPFLRLTAAAAALLLCACTVAPAGRGDSAQQSWQQRHAQLADVRDWRLRGRIGIVTERDSGTASLQWEQRGESFTLRIVAPFGRGLLAIEGSEQGVTARNGKGEQSRADNAEDLLWRHTGWRIPLADLRYWVLGLTAPDSGGSYRLDRRGRLAGLEEDGWQVEYHKYTALQKHELPANMHLQNEHLKIKLAISAWEILSPQQSATESALK
jgi:outer membrane lipoprotein LolB